MRTNILFLLFAFVPFSLPAQSGYRRIHIADDLELIRLSEKAYVHVSYMEMQSFGKVGANGLLLVDKGEAFLFDSPWNDAQTEKLVAFISDSLKTGVSTFIPGHWHEDCVGGMEYLHSKGVKSYAHQMTVDILKEKGLPAPQQGFRDSLALKLNDIEVYCYYLGAGHSTDNIVAWIPSEQILFGGCMVKDLHSKDPGNLSDAKPEEWPETIQKVTAKFPGVKTVIPGHGRIGGKELLKHTEELLQQFLLSLY
ncbi:MAG: subclass B1 metallo-beta-lactamase [Tannerella sp.]|jgi:metallo-beta-lactamase class B|nr:subclass B1 metallo-beta-lactamase [Tannerella sp.]